MLEFVICDDNKLICNDVKHIIKNVCSAYNIDSNINIFYDYDSNFIKFMSNNKSKVIYILDIETPSESGISIAKAIRKKDKNSIIIFLTSHDELAYSIISGRFNILTFISKMLDYKSELYKAIENAITYVNPVDYVEFNDNKTNYSIKANSILYITKDFRKTLIVTDNKSYDVYLSLNKLKSLLPPYFLQSHRACIVNTERIEKINFNHKTIMFDNGDEIDLLSDTYKKELVIACKN